MSDSKAPLAKPFSMAIVGGGIGGLALAIGLRRRGITAHIYEAAPAFAEIGAGVAFGPNSIRSMALIDPAIRAVFHRLATKNGSKEDEETWITFRCGVGDPTLITKVQTTDADRTGLSSVHRAHFLHALASLLPDGMAHFRKRLSRLESQASGAVRLFFEDGSTAEADAVVGCDGVRSRVRQFVLETDNALDCLSFSGKYVYRGLIPMAKAKDVLGEDLATNSQMYLGPGAHVLTYPIDRGTIMNVVAFKDKPDGVWEHPHWVLPKKGAEMIRDFDGFGAPVRRVLQTMEDADLWALFDHKPAPTYFNGRVAILGDAAHASTPHQGAGAGMALEDAFILSTLLADERTRSGSDISAAFKAYDAIRRPRSQRVVTTSRAAGEMYAFRGPAGGDLAKIRVDLLTRQQWIWDEDMDRQARLAQLILAQINDDGATSTWAVVPDPASPDLAKPGDGAEGMMGPFQAWSASLIRTFQKLYHAFWASGVSLASLA